MSSEQAKGKLAKGGKLARGRGAASASGDDESGAEFARGAGQSDDEKRRSLQALEVMRERGLIDEQTFKARLAALGGPSALKR